MASVTESDSFRLGGIACQLGERNRNADGVFTEQTNYEPEIKRANRRAPK